MAAIIEILKSKGKMGGIGLMLLGIAQIVLVYLGKIGGTIQEGVTTFLLGLGVLGIRSKQDKPLA